MSFLDNLHYIKQQSVGMMDFLQENKVSIIKGPTGCGKSTYIPYMLQRFSVVLVEPRRIAVKSIFNSLKDKIENLSYKMRFDSFTCDKLKSLQRNCVCKKYRENDIENSLAPSKYCNTQKGTGNEASKMLCRFCIESNKSGNVEIVTDGIFLNNLNKYLEFDYIIIDEVHERSARIDLILGILKEKTKNKLILMSATINTKVFEGFFDAKVFEIKGQRYKADIFYDNVDDYIVGSFLKIKEIVEKDVKQKEAVESNMHINTGKEKPHYKMKTVDAQNNSKRPICEDSDTSDGTFGGKENTCKQNSDQASEIKVPEVRADRYKITDGESTINQEKSGIENEIDEIFEPKKQGSAQLHTKENDDILVFLPGEEDINDLFKLVRTLPQTKAYKIYSLLSDKKQSEIFDHTPLVKVIISTNICETSLTIPGIKYVIDCGLAKEKIYNGCAHLGIKKIGKDNADQRKGRCNRTKDGVCYRLYDEDTYYKMSYSQSEIEKCDMTDHILLLLYHNYNVFEFEFITYPNMQNVKEAIKYLCYIKAIEYKSDVKNFKITKYGQRLLRNPIDVKLSHFLEICKKYDVVQLGIALASLISQEQVDFLSIENVYESDIEEYISIFKEYLDGQSYYEKINSKYSAMQIKGFERAVNIYNQLYKNGSAFEYTKEQITMLEQAFSDAFCWNKMIRQDNGSYKGQVESVYLFPTSNFYKKRVKNIVCIGIWNTRKCYARFVGRYIENRE